ncbi:myo-inositol-1-monophosphatase [Aulographum hederae CBS 113979]|uniref:3'(2'),5'-bisphosphate nucleotidase n=1 Tax=Aulographum hederae CBS 113979 TaxID=1176131 RepID=A0A6G1GWU4_9PEZI|nr:myo-inositol-1-monophosphatase [Aulographum hederae CBS 113979]
MTSPYEAELRLALLTVQRAALLTKALLNSIDKGAMEKSDDTPVTIADLGAQALLISALHSAFPSDSFVGEESATMLREDPALCDRVWNLVESTHLEDAEADAELARPKTKEELLDLIDLGTSSGKTNRGRIWVMDPIDGTATYMRGEQYAVCLCLLVDGTQEVAVLGCPNLDVTSGPICEASVPKPGVDGVILSAVRGRGAFIGPLTAGRLPQPTKIEQRKSIQDWSKAIMVESLNSSSMDQEKCRKVAEELGVKQQPIDLWSTQLKYVALAVGGHDFMLRIPKDAWHRSCVWDHAGGDLIYQESGGKVTDMSGNPVNHGAGRRLYDNCGNVCAPEGSHHIILETVEKVGR